jgi:hypothetical protein
MTLLMSHFENKTDVVGAGSDINLCMPSLFNHEARPCGLIDFGQLFAQVNGGTGQSVRHVPVHKHLYQAQFNGILCNRHLKLGALGQSSESFQKPIDCREL